MRILLIEDDLLWTSRLAHAAKAMGAETVVVKNLDTIESADAAIVNLSHRSLDLGEVATRLRDAGIVSVAHAGHKEKPLLEMGRSHGFDRIATNGELAHKLCGILTGLLPRIELEPNSESPEDKAS